jgi:hypothetical protein
MRPATTALKEIKRVSGKKHRMNQPESMYQR